MQLNLSQSLGCKTQVSGDENGGRIAFAYGNREELEMLLTKLGVALPKGQEEGQPEDQATEEAQKEAGMGE